MTWSPDTPEDGDAVTADSVNDLFTTAQAWLGNVTRAGFRRGTFNRFHALSLLQPNSEGYTVANNEGSNLIEYTVATFGDSIKWVSWGHDGGSGDAGDLGDADRAIVGHESNDSGYTGNTALLTLPGDGIHVGFENGDRVAFLLVMFNCQVNQADSKNSPVDLNIALSFSIQYEVDGSGVWKTVRRSERWLSLSDHISDPFLEGEAIYFDVPIALALGPDIVDDDYPATGAAGHPITAIRAMVTAVAFDSSNGQAYFIVDNFRLTAIPIMAED